MSQFRPMLGATPENMEQLKYPLFASTKLDGVRAIWYGKEFLSRTLKTIPNRAIQKEFMALGIPSGYDGELIYGAPNAPDVYRKTNSIVMTINGSAEDVKFFVFDNCEYEGQFYRRLESLSGIFPGVVKLNQTLISNYTELQEYEEEVVSAGFEGVMLRSPSGRYKQGRSTMREQYMVKLKRFVDAEATIIGFKELLHNANPAGKDERGYTKRSSHKENKVPMGRLGALIVSMGSVEFDLGTGFTDRDRMAIWSDRDKYLGKLVKFKSLLIGVKDAPRHPVFLGFRDSIDK